MKPHTILKSFSGSHDGINTKHFEAGAVTPLSDSLAAIVVKEGWAKEHIEQPASNATEREAKVLAIPETKTDAIDDAEQPKKKKKG